MAVNDVHSSRSLTKEAATAAQDDFKTDAHHGHSTLLRTASPDDGRASTAMFNPFFTGRPRTPVTPSKQSAIDRQEIIRRIKNGESRPTSPQLERALSNEYSRKRKSPTPESPNPAMSASRPKSPEWTQDNKSIGQQIERPRSALHRGDFRDRNQTASTPFTQFNTTAEREALHPLSTSPVAPWHAQFPAAAFSRAVDERVPHATHASGLPIPRPLRPRTISNASLATSWAYKPPTSPLVQSSRPDTPESAHRRRSRSPDKSRRHTFSPDAFRRFSPSVDDAVDPTLHASRPRPLAVQSEQTSHYQAHQPRRSLHSVPFSSLPYTSMPRLRAPSLSESPLHHAPMVGSYEESILRGRMSTTPSKPLNFLAQIGVLGKGNCKSSLRCPPHVSVPFPAVFYSYNTASRSSDQPSPYVGLIDLENTLAKQDPSHTKRHALASQTASQGASRASSQTREEGDVPTSDMHRRRHRAQHRAKRRSASPKAPPGGSYRIPQQGQLQIVIKNPNKTAVKLFLVPYDLCEMEPGQKTFIRQRSYSAGPIIDMPLSSRKNLGTDRPEASLNPTDDPNDKPMLRYLIHLHICSPSKGRFYLYKSIRVVFANRVPDGKENLRNEIQCPEPRYSAYRPNRESLSLTPSSVLLDQRRKGARYSYDATVSTLASPESGFSTSPAAYCAPTYIWPQQGTPTKPFAQSLPASHMGGNTTPNFRDRSQISKFPSTRLPTLESRPGSRHLTQPIPISPSPANSASHDMPTQSPLYFPTSPSAVLPHHPSPPFAESEVASPLFNRRPTTPLYPPLGPSARESNGNTFNNRPRNTSLLSQRLMGLAVQNSSSGPSSAENVQHSEEQENLHSALDKDAMRDYL